VTALLPLALILLAGCNAAATDRAARPPAAEAQGGSSAAGATQQPASKQATEFDAARAWEHLRAQVAIGPRVAGTPENRKTREYIIGTLKALGITATEQPFEAQTPIGRVPMANVIATLRGTRPERIILGSHFDTKLFKEFRFVGANDGGSSTAALLELARVLKERPRTFTIDLLFLDGEEAFVQWDLESDSTYGSRYYVQQAKATGTLAGIKAFILLDMIADPSLNIRREENSTPWLTDIIWATARRLRYQQHFLSEVTPIEDDHIPFLRAGVPAVDIIDLDYDAWHTAQDTLDNISQRSLQVVGDVVVAALPEIEQRLLKQ
jgi:glutaminyl-peptide cyclotransferase